MISNQMSALRTAMNRYRGVLAQSRLNASLYPRESQLQVVVGIRHNTYDYVSHIYAYVYFINVCGFSGWNRQFVITGTTAISQHSTTWDYKHWLYMYLWWTKTIYD